MATSMTTAPTDAATSGTVRVRWLASARVLIQLAWARTASPVMRLGMLALVLLPMLFAILFASRGTLSGDPVVFLVSRYDQLVCALATPLLALLLGTSAFSAESEDGTLLYLVTTTTPRWWIVAVRTLFAALGAGALSSLAVWGTGYFAAAGADPDGVTRAFTIATFYGGAAYASLFTALALLTRRSLVVGLVYVLFWEGVLSSTFRALDWLSVRRWMGAVAAVYTEADGVGRDSGPTATFALAAAAVLVVFTVYVGGRQLHEPRLTRLGT
ncbi:MAG: hypothetical protein LCH84_07150 [Gemmatimonadetes bacterium]|nr:hypothetical protein [Gemmatimonadota bacterium]